MKTVKLLAMVAVVGLFTYALVAADDAPKPERAKGIRGTVVKVDGANLFITKMAKDEADRVPLTILTDEKTVVKNAAGEVIKLADLKAADRVLITPETATDKAAAATITVMKPRAPRA